MKKKWNTGNWKDYDLKILITVSDNLSGAVGCAHSVFLGGKVNPPVRIADIINIVSQQSHNTSYYLDRKRGELFLVPKEQLRAAEDNTEQRDYPEWEKMQIKLAREILADVKGERYIRIPAKFASHEYSTMENFCFSLADKEIAGALLQAIFGGGAFNRFNACIHRYKIADDWYTYRYNSMKRIVIEWCEENDIEYVTK